MADAARRSHHHLFVGALAHDGLADGARRGDAVLFDVGLFGADERVDEGLLEVEVLERNGRAEADDARVYVVRLDDLRFAELIFELEDAVLELFLFFFRRVVLGVLAEVSEALASSSFAATSERPSLRRETSSALSFS